MLSKLSSGLTSGSKRSNLMKWLITAALFLFLIQLGIASAYGSAGSSGFYELTAQSITGKPVKLSEYKGKLVMVVNVASQCGFTPQYKGLQDLYEKNKAKGFVILGFPSNDFGSQEPGKNEEIQEFCKLNYGVKFPLFSKNPVSGDAKQPVYKYLLANAPTHAEVAWNFEKFLVTPTGQIVSRWKSAVAPDSAEIQKAIDANLPSAKAL